MSKTQFIDGDPSQGIKGTKVTAAFLNAGNNHYHTGLDEDGHGCLPYAADSGTANAYVVTLSPALTQYVIGMPIYFKAANACTGASSINVNGLGNVAIKKNIQDLSTGDIQSGQIIMLVYDGLNFQLIGTINADTVDMFHASTTPGQNVIPVGGAGGKLANDVDTVDTYHHAYVDQYFSNIAASAESEVEIATPITSSVAAGKTLILVIPHMSDTPSIINIAWRCKAANWLAASYCVTQGGSGTMPAWPANPSGEDKTTIRVRNNDTAARSFYLYILFIRGAN